MRIEGKLTKWNGDRGFGFITPVNGGQDIFVHVSAFPRGGPKPRVGEVLSFEIELNEDKKKRAANVMRPSRPAPAAGAKTAIARPQRPAPGRPRWRIRSVVLTLAVALGVYAYSQYSNRHAARMAVPLPEAAAPRAAPAAPPAAARPPDVGWRCDGRVHCSQMTSCAEAKFFLSNCPGVKMDGDGDGVPCEEQWCTERSAR
ncbi:MAG: cold shock domain-containing protein [Burkholderiales bacterium]|jgi:cold shock CspA family protein|nr:cold shock domain-containing protein [Burkholderiales bacterium]